MILETTLMEIRVKMGLTQGNLAKRLGVTTQFLSNVERGKARLPKPYFKKVSKLLDIPVKQMIKLRVQDLEKDMLEELC